MLAYSAAEVGKLCIIYTRKQFRVGLVYYLIDSDGDHLDLVTGNLQLLLTSSIFIM